MTQKKVTIAGSDVNVEQGMSAVTNSMTLSGDHVVTTKTAGLMGWGAFGLGFVAGSTIARDGAEAGRAPMLRVGPLKVG